MRGDRVEIALMAVVAVELLAVIALSVTMLVRGVP